MNDAVIQAISQHIKQDIKYNNNCKIKYDINSISLKHKIIKDYQILFYDQKHFYNVAVFLQNNFSNIVNIHTENHTLYFTQHEYLITNNNNH